MTKHKIITCFLFTTLLLLAQGVYADWSQYYIGFGYGQGSYEQANSSAYEFADFKLKFGRDLNEYIAVEVHAGLGGKDTQTFSGTPVSLEIENYFALFLRGNINLTGSASLYHQIKLYGLFGGTYLNTNASDGAVTRDGTEYSLAYGLGLEVYGSDNTAIYLGWERYVDDDNNGIAYTFETLSVGFVYHFDE